MMFRLEKVRGIATGRLERHVVKRLDSHQEARVDLDSAQCPEQCRTHLIQVT